MSDRLTRTFAIVGWTIALAAAVGAIAWRIVDPAPFIPTGFGFSQPALVGFEFLGLTFALVGGLLVVRRPRNLVGWFMVLIGDGYALAGLTAAVTFSAVADGPTGAANAGYFGWLTVLFTTLGGLVFGLGFIFPTGRGHTPTWDRRLRRGAVITPVLGTVLFLIRPGALHVFPTIENPFGVGPDLRPLLGPDVSSVIAGCSALFVPVLAWSIISRYRMSDDIGRRQLKWFILAILVTLAAVAITAVSGLVMGRATEIGLIVFSYAGALVPIAIGMAILRYHLYDIDRLVSRTITYGLVTGVLLAIFTSMSVVIGSAVGSTGDDALTTAASTLVAAAMFNPIRNRIQRVVDRRFNRARYDAQRTATGFADRLRHQLDLPMLREELRQATIETVEPHSTAVWLRPRGSR